ncbi:MAG: 4Fe-4S dicluster domain-containing protein [Acidobacteria bacterium]|nr:4Fe-4S dicluster domain-containing protein [Acidobacteriota bacterium]
MARKLDEPQDRGDFFKSLGTLFAGFLADQIEDAVTGVAPRLLRPPGALDEFEFLTACTRCDKCIKACPQDSIRKAGGGAGLGVNTPYLEVRSMPCFLCTDLPCIPACPDGALLWPTRTLASGEVLDGPRAVKMGTARILEDLCLTFSGEDKEPQVCRTCVDRCPYPGVAIAIPDTEDGSVPHPRVIEECCTGCGLCVFGCPTPKAAIIVEPRR